MRCVIFAAIIHRCYAHGERLPVGRMDWGERKSWAVS
jgi:hypothetical protein